MADRGCPLEPVPLPAEVRESLAELELELSEGERPGRGAPQALIPDPGPPPCFSHPGTLPRPSPETPPALPGGHPGSLPSPSHRAPWTPGPLSASPPGARTFGCPAGWLGRLFDLRRVNLDGSDCLSSRRWLSQPEAAGLGFTSVALPGRLPPTWARTCEPISACVPQFPPL